MGNHNSYIEEEQTTQWPKEKVQTTGSKDTPNICFMWKKFVARYLRFLTMTGSIPLLVDY